MRDMRLVQTAVVGHRKSDDPVLMPFDTHEALALRAALANRSLWCGHLLGGCGKQLTMRIGAIKIPHFAHHPDSRSGSVECRRANLDASSADHLYINRGLTRLMRLHGLQPGGTRFDGQFASGGGCQRLTLDIPQGDGVIVVALRGTDLDRWRDEEEELLRRRSWVNWLFGPGVRAPADLLDRDGRSFHLWFESRPAGRTLLVGTQVTGQPTEWTELERSRIDKAGFSTPYSRALPSPHSESTASAPIPAVDPVPGIEAAPADSDRETSAAASSGSSAYQRVVELEDGSEVALAELRSLLGRLSRRYGLLNQRDKAFVCIEYARALKTQRPQALQLEDWLLGDLAALRAGLDLDTVRGPEPRALIDPGRTLDAEPPAPGLNALLRECGWDPSKNPQRTRWLALGRMHSSYRHERGASIDASPAILGVLEEVGKRWLALTVLDRQTREHRSSTVEEQSSNHAALKALLDQSLLTMPEFAAAARFGTGEYEQGTDPAIPARLRLTVIHQICGVMALLNGVGAVQELVNRCFPTIWTQYTQRSTAHTDWRTALISLAPQTVFEYATEGPDHVPQHTATATDRRGRSATGTAGSKKAAAQLASEHFIRLHYPAAVDRMRSTTSTSARTPLPLPRELTSHWRAIDDARLEFGLSDKAAAELSQAFIHKSWTPENQALLEQSSQRDNSVLAHHGSVVAEVMAAQYRAQSLLSSTLDLDRDQAALAVPPIALWREAFAASSLRPGVLLSEGQSAKPTETYGDVMQALLAVAWRRRGIGMLIKPPPLLRTAVDALKGANHTDAYTRLTQSLTPFNIQLEERFNATGPDHDRAFRCTITLVAGERRVNINGARAKSKATAKKTCAERILDLIETTSRAEEWSLSDQAKQVAHLLFTQQISHVAALAVSQRTRLVRCGILGTTHLTTDNLEDFAAWAEQVTDLIGEITAEQAAQLTEFYIKSLHTTRYPRPNTIRQRILDLCTRIEQGAIDENDHILVAAAEKILQLEPDYIRHRDIEAMSAAAQWIFATADRHGHRIILETDNERFTLTAPTSDPDYLLDPMRSLLIDQFPHINIDVNDRQITITTDKPIDRPQSILQAGATALEHKAISPTKRRIAAVRELKSALELGDPTRVAKACGRARKALQ